MDYSIHFILNNEDYANCVAQFILTGALAHYQLSLVDISQPLPSLNNPTLLIHDLDFDLFSALELTDRGYIKIIKLVEGSVEQDEQDPYQPIEKIIQYAIDRGRSQGSPSLPMRGPKIIWISKVSQDSHCDEWIHMIYTYLQNKRKATQSFEMLRGNKGSKSKVVLMTLLGSPEHPNGISFADFIWQNGCQNNGPNLSDEGQPGQSSHNAFIFQDSNGLFRLPGIEYMDDYYQIDLDQFLTTMPHFIAQFDLEYILIEGNPICDLKALQMARCSHLHVLYETQKNKGIGKLSSQVMRWVNSQNTGNYQLKNPPFYIVDRENHSDFDAFFMALSAVNHV